MTQSREPFFARFLENQKAETVKTGLKAGRPPIVTLKYPSDDDEYPTS